MPITIIEDLVQGTDEWFLARAGYATGSQLGKIITPTGKPSAQQDDLIDKLAVEAVEHKFDESFKSDWMKRGNELEPDAFDRFCFDKMVMVRKVGLIYRDGMRAACSPDGIFENEEIGLEIKCPKLSTYSKYHREGVLPDIYKPQVQGSMFITGYEKWWFMVYHPGYQPFYLLVEPDRAYQKAFSIILDAFLKKLDERIIDLQALRDF